MDDSFVKSMWSEDLIRNLLSLYIQNKDLLEARHSIVATEQNKARAWASIAQTLNTSSSEKKTVEQLKKKIRDMKQQSRKFVDMMKKPKTGGGKGPRKPWYVDTVLDHIIGNNSATLNGIDGM